MRVYVCLGNRIPFYFLFSYNLPCAFESSSQNHPWILIPGILPKDNQVLSYVYKITREHLLSTKVKDSS